MTFTKHPKGGLVSCACWNAHVTMGCKKSGFLMLIVCFCLFAGITLPYLTTVIRKILSPLLPFVSHAAGEPPSSGVLAFFLIIAGISGIVAFNLLNTCVKQRNLKGSKIIKKLYMPACVISFIMCLGAIIVSAFPISYSDRLNKFDWFFTVFFPHCIGATMALVGQVVHQFLLTIMWWYLPDVNKRIKFIKIGFAVIYLILGLIIAYPLTAFVLKEMEPEYFNFVLMKKIYYKLPTEFSTYYLIGSFGEWILCMLSMIFYLLLYKDMQKISFRIVLRHKSCLAETMEPVPSISLKVLS